MQFEFRMAVEPAALTSAVHLDGWVEAAGCRVSFAGELVIWGEGNESSARRVCRLLAARFLSLLAARTGLPVRPGPAVLAVGEAEPRTWHWTGEPSGGPWLDETWEWDEVIRWALACLPWASHPAVGRFLRFYRAALYAEWPEVEAACLRRALLAVATPAGVSTCEPTATPGLTALRLRLLAEQFLEHLPQWGRHLAAGGSPAAMS